MGVRSGVGPAQTAARARRRRHPEDPCRNVRTPPELMRALLLLVCACNAVRPPQTRPPHEPPHTLLELAGGWRWLLRSADSGTTRVEDEHWRFAPIVGDPSHLAGRYV